MHDSTQISTPEGENFAIPYENRLLDRKIGQVS